MIFDELPPSTRILQTQFPSIIPSNMMGLSVISEGLQGRPKKEKGFFAFVRLVRLRVNHSSFGSLLLGRLGCQVPWKAPNVEELITPDLICPSTYQLLQNFSGDSGPDLSFDKSTSLGCLFSLADVSLGEASKPLLSFGCSEGDYISSSVLPRMMLWSPTGRMFDLKGKIIKSSESESQSDCSKGDNTGDEIVLSKVIYGVKIKDNSFEVSDETGVPSESDL
nr:hypothetical protein [Tanacetum cinerariifolium]